MSNHLPSLFWVASKLRTAQLRRGATCDLIRAREVEGRTIMQMPSVVGMIAEAFACVDTSLGSFPATYATARFVTGDRTSPITHDTNTMLSGWSAAHTQAGFSGIRLVALNYGWADRLLLPQIASAAGRYRWNATSRSVVLR